MTSREAPSRNPCERCGNAMAAVSRVPGLGPHPELVTFRCDGCGHVLTVEASRGQK